MSVDEDNVVPMVHSLVLCVLCVDQDNLGTLIQSLVLYVLCVEQDNVRSSNDSSS